jgi:hypothetical protein
MSRVITFSRTFPAYHYKAGKPTYFIEQFYNSIFEKDGDWSNAPEDEKGNYVVELSCFRVDKKHHTIRSGKRWKVGDRFSPRVWSGKPYASKMIQFAPDTEIKKIWDFEIIDSEYLLNGKRLSLKELSEIAMNDGLEVDDLELWFSQSKTFSGQIICWNENINY